VAFTYTDSVSPATGLQFLVYGHYGPKVWPVTNGARSRVWGSGSSFDSTTFGVSNEESDDIGGYISVPAYDTSYGVTAWTTTAAEGFESGAELQAKSNAQAALADTPTSSAITSSTATIACDYTPNVNASTCSAQLQYKKTTDPSWTNAGSAQTTGGSSEIPISRNITGLTASTQYQVRLVITRTTNNDTSLTSATASFTTEADVPSVTTDAATGVAATSAILNGTLDINGGTGVNVYFKWGTDNPPTQNTTANQSKSADGSFDQAISGLSASTTYYVQAFASFSTPAGSPVSGSVQSFATPADPLADAAEEDHVRIFYFDRKYGVEDAVTFVIPDVASSSSDRFINAASPFASGDVKISIDGGAVANTSNLPVRIGSTPLFSLTLTAAELQGSEIDVYLVDQNGPAWRDTLLKIRTEMLLGNVQIDAATGQKANTSAFKVSGYGSGHGIEAVKGATGQDINGILAEMVVRTGTAAAGGASSIPLDAAASATNDWYNGNVIEIIAGTGVGQARVITDYDGGTLVATVDSAWATNPSSDSVFLIRGGARPWNLSPGVELAAIPTAASSFGLLLQFIFQRFAYKITQTATLQTLFKADSSTSLGTRSASDNGTTQTLGKVS